jgi:S-formylglutathione hydrolase
MKTASHNGWFGGVQGVYSHASIVCGCEMTFAVCRPPQARTARVPVLWFLSGRSCTHENAIAKAGAHGREAREGIALIFSDTSPRGNWPIPDSLHSRAPQRRNTCPTSCAPLSLPP